METRLLRKRKTRGTFAHLKLPDNEELKDSLAESIRDTGDKLRGQG
jgi:hypothetical protein